MDEEKPETVLISKIKQEQDKEKEKESKIKSSSEILIELFGVFNAPPPSIEDLKHDSPSSHKQKKSKKKHKHKDKKKKKAKKRGRSSSDSDNDPENVPVKKKSKKSKHKKHKKKSIVNYSEGSSDEEASQKISIKTEDSEERDSKEYKKDRANNYKYLDTKDHDIKNEEIVLNTTDLSNIVLPNEHSSNNTSTKSDLSTDKSKFGFNKIQIKNLKYSTVFEETVKQVEEEARKRAEKYEEGEISSSSEDSSLKQSKSEGNDRIKNKNKEQSKKYTERDISPKSDNLEETHKSHSRKIDTSSKRYNRSPHRSDSRSKHKRSRSRSRHESGRSKRHSRSKSKERHARKKYSESKSLNSFKYSSKHEDKRSLYKTHDKRRSNERDNRTEIDKKRLLEIARKNAINMLQNGSLPAALNLGQQAQQKVLSAIKSGGKSVDELTDFCKTLSRKEALGELSSVSSDEGSDHDNGSIRPFHHPFQVKDKPPIVLNIKGGVPLPVQSFQEKTIEQTKNLRLQFPVSSGSQHRGAENEWRPVSPPKSSPTLPKHVPNPPFYNSNKPNTTIPKPIETIAYTIQNENNLQSHAPGVIQLSIVPNILPGPQVFPTDISPSLDLGSIVSQRLSAIRKLQENPNDPSAMNQIYEVNKEMSKWAQSKQEPGQFTGSTGAQILTPKELASGIQAWAKPDQLQTAAPVTGGMGMHLLQKMGWRPGEGLGKQKNGSLTPLLLEVKLDTRGLVAKEEARGRNPKRTQGPTIKTLAGKHPVSLLGEFCSKRKLGVPSYSLCYESGPDHKKNFLFKVTVNGIEYQPNVASANKKQAKADAAQLCLQQLGLVI